MAKFANLFFDDYPKGKIKKKINPQGFNLSARRKKFPRVYHRCKTCVEKTTRRIEKVNVLILIYLQYRQGTGGGEETD